MKSLNTALKRNFTLLHRAKELNRGWMFYAIKSLLIFFQRKNQKKKPPSAFKNPSKTTFIYELLINSKMDHETTVSELKEKVRQFCEERDWDQYHNAKELCIGIVTEAAELLQHFRFKSEEQTEQMLKNPEVRQEISEEMADVLYFLLRLAQMNKIDLAEELGRKIEKNKNLYKPLVLV
mgnify:CR=1 FL=1